MTRVPLEALHRPVVGGFDDLSLRRMDFGRDFDLVSLKQHRCTQLNHSVDGDEASMPFKKDHWTASPSPSMVVDSISD